MKQADKKDIHDKAGVMQAEEAGLCMASQVKGCVTQLGKGMIQCGLKTTRLISLIIITVLVIYILL